MQWTWNCTTQGPAGGTFPSFFPLYPYPHPGLGPAPSARASGRPTRDGLSPPGLDGYSSTTVQSWSKLAQTSILI
jgi:hypothetical protein